jgi:hypothetical protein
MVINEGNTITKAAKKLIIKVPTARIIIKKYNERGTFTVRKVERAEGPPQRALQPTETEPKPDDVPPSNSQQQSSEQPQPNVVAETVPFISFYIENDLIWLFMFNPAPYP